MKDVGLDHLAVEEPPKPGLWTKNRNRDETEE